MDKKDLTDDAGSSEDDDISSDDVYGGNGYDNVGVAIEHEQSESASESICLKSSGDRDWNGEFQNLIKEINQLATQPEDADALNQSLLKARELRRLCLEFAETATTIGVKIIKELFVPDSKKQIRPIAQRMGIAGGVKYKHSGIFFKLSRDWQNIYGSDAMAMKSSEHELKGCMAYLDCRIQGLHTPLMALVRYRGYALVAQSILPISRKTILYGSNDAGCTIYCEDKELIAKFEAAAKIINIKGHRVWNRDRTKSCILHAPIDVEGHKGADGLFYVIDTARVFPPRWFLKEKSRAAFHLCRLFRPEFVKLNPVPLSSDALSRFGKEDSEQHTKEIKDATDRLHNEVIPSFCAFIEERYQRKSSNESNNKPVVLSGMEIDDDEEMDDRLQLEQGTIDDLSQLVAELHMHGINCQLLLHVYARVKTPRLKVLVLTEVCARTAKNIIEEKWRCLEAESDKPYIREAIKFFNDLFTKQQDKSASAWETHLKPVMLENFSPLDYAAHEAFCSSSFDLRQHIDILLFFLRTSQLLGLDLDFNAIGATISNFTNSSKLPDVCPQATTSQSMLTDSETLPAGAYEVVRQFLRRHTALTIACVRTIKPRTKYIHRVSFEEGTALTRIALSRLKIGDRTEASRLLTQAIQRFKECWEIKPSDHRALYNWALALASRAELTENPEEAQQLWKEVSEKYAKALVLHPKDWKALWKWGTALCVQAHHTKGQEANELLSLACEKLNMAVSMLPRPHYPTLYNAGNAHLNLARLIVDQLTNDSPNTTKATASSLLKEAIKHLKAAVALKGSSVDAHRNLGIAYSTLARLTEDDDTREAYFEATAISLQKALHLDPTSWEIYYGWGNALFRRATMLREKQKKNELVCSAFADAALKYLAALTVAPSIQSCREPLVNLGTVLSVIGKLAYRTETKAVDAKPKVPRRIANVMKSCGSTFFSKLSVLHAAGESLLSLERALSVLTKYGPRKVRDAAARAKEAIKLPSEQAIVISKVLKSKPQPNKYQPEKTKETAFTTETKVSDLPPHRRRRSNSASPAVKNKPAFSSLISSSDDANTLLGSGTDQKSARKSTPKETTSSKKKRRLSTEIEDNSIAKPALTRQQSLGSQLELLIKRDRYGDIDSLQVDDIIDSSKKKAKSSLSKPKIEKPKGEKEKVKKQVKHGSVELVASKADYVKKSFKLFSESSKKKYHTAPLINVSSDSKRSSEKAKKRSSDTKKEMKKHKDVRGLAAVHPTKQPTRHWIKWDSPSIYSHDALPVTSESELAIEKVVGYCRSGMVFAVSRGQQKHALKFVKKTDVSSLPTHLFVFDHPFIVKLRYIFHTDAKILMLFDLIHGIPLLEFSRQKKLDEYCIKFFAAQLVSAVSYLLSCPFVYRDFKPENVLVTNTGNICLTTYWDFDQSKHRDYRRASQAYLAPELRSHANNTLINEEEQGAIWWSVGVFLLTLLSGDNPFEKVTYEEMGKLYPISFPTGVSQLCQNFIQRLLERDVASRLTNPLEVKGHKWFEDIDWNKLDSLDYNPPIKLSDLTYRTIFDQNSTPPINRRTLLSSTMSTMSRSSSSSSMISIGDISHTLLAPDAANVLEGYTIVYPQPHLEDK